jgi:hypothetical protein
LSAVSQVPRIRLSLVQEQDWEAIAEEQKHTFFGEQSKAVSERHMRSLLSTLDALCSMQVDHDLDSDKVNQAG